MTRIGGSRGPSGPKGPAGGGKVGGASGKFNVGGTGGASSGSGQGGRSTFLSDVRLLAEAVRAGQISEEVAFERLVQTAVSRRIVGAGAGDATVIRSVTEIVREDPLLAGEIRKLLADAAKGEPAKGEPAKGEPDR